MDRHINQLQSRFFVRVNLAQGGLETVLAPLDAKEVLDEYHKYVIINM